MSISYEAPLQAGIAEIVCDFFSKHDGTEPIGTLLNAIRSFVDQLSEDIMARQPPPQALACSAGCGYCCRGYEVHVSPLEALAIAEHLAQTLSSEALVRLVERLLETQEAKEHHFPDDRPRVNFTCPLLDAEICQIYAVRPFTCQAFNAYDAKACEQRKLHGDETAVIYGYAHPRHISDRVHLGFQQGLRDIKLEAHPLDLTPALLIVLTQPDARDRWLAGEAVFTLAHARLLEA